MSGKVPQDNTQMQQMQSTKYADLLAVIEELGKDIKPTYAGMYYIFFH